MSSSRKSSCRANAAYACIIYGAKTFFIPVGGFEDQNRKKKNRTMLEEVDEEIKNEW